MSTILASAVISRAATLLQDTTNIRWPQAELLDWLNDAQREVTLYKPNAYVKNTLLQLVAGTKQAMPADANVLVDVPRNMGASGTVAGPAVRIVSREILDAQSPNWHATSGANAVVKHYMYSERDPKTFYVYPPQPAVSPAQVEIIYSAAPGNVLATDVILVDDSYMTALVNYVMHRAYSKDVEYAVNKDLAGAYYSAFIAMLGGKNTGEVATDPNAHAKGNRNMA